MKRGRRSKHDGQTTPAPPGDLGREAPGAPRWSRGPWLAAALATVAFVPALMNDFTYDDIPIIRDNIRLHDPANIPTLWLSDYWRPAGEDARVLDARRDRLYRPLAMTTYALNLALHGARPAGFLLVNLLLHALAAALVWHVAHLLLRDRATATCAALLFALHPIHVEAVANIVGRAELLGAVGMLAGLLVLLRGSRPPGVRAAVVASALFFMALASKESAICYPVVALIALLARGRSALPATWPRRIALAAVLLVPVAVYLPLRHAALGGHLTRIAPPSHYGNPLTIATPLQCFVGVFTIIGNYARLLVLPNRLSADYGLAVIDPAAGANVMTILGALVSLATLVALLGIFRPGRPVRIVATLAAIFVASYVLISNAFLTIGVTLAERLMYWPSVPFLMVASVGIMAAWRKISRANEAKPATARLIGVAGVAVLAALGLRSSIRATDWQSNLTLFETDVRTHPQSIHINLNLAEALVNKPARSAEDLRRADECIARALEISPRTLDALQLGGIVAYLLKDNARAARYLELATSLGPVDELSQEILAEVRGATAEANNRIAALRELTARDPQNTAMHLELGEVLLSVGRYRDAFESAQTAQQQDPESPAANWLLARAAIGTDQTPRAVAALRRLIAADPENWRAHTQLAVLLHIAAPKQALDHARIAHQLAPIELETNQNLAEVLAANGRIDEAIKLFRLIERGLPEGDPLRAAIAARIADLEQDR